MSVFNRIPRYLVRALSAGAMVVAAVLPLAAAGTAGAATTPATLSSLYTNTGTSGSYSTTPAVVTYTGSVTAPASSSPFGATATITASGYAYWPIGTTFVANANTYTTTAAATLGTTASPVAVTASSGSVLAAPSGAVTTVNYGTEVISYTVSAGVLSASINVGTTITIPAGTGIAATGIPANDYLTASASITAASAPLSLAIPLPSTTNTGNLGAVTYSTSAQQTLPTFGAGGASATVFVTGSGFAANGGTVTFATDAAGVTFTNATELSSTLASATLTTGASTPGFYGVTITDGNGTTTALANAFQIASAPVVTTVSPSTVLASGSAQSLSLTGSGLVTGQSVVFTSEVDGTTITAGTITASSTTSATVSVTAQNSVTLGSATPGAYDVTITGGTSGNVFGGISTTTKVLTVNSFGFTSASPSYIPLVGASGAAATTTITLNGTNLGTSGALQVSTSATYASGSDVTAAWQLTTTSITNSAITATITEPAAYNIAGLLSFQWTNSSGSVSTFNGAIGVGQSSTASGNAPAITSVSSVGTLSIGSAATLVVTGTNFVPSATTASFNVGGTTTANPSLSCTSFTAISTTTGTCVLNGSAVSSSTVAGPQDLVLTTAAGSGTYKSALTIAGPVITAASPSVLGIGVGQVVTLTGTGFPTTGTTFGVTVTGATAASSNGGTSNAATVVSATSATVYLTASQASVTITIPGVSTVSTTSPTFSMTAGAAPTIGAASYASTTAGVGVGASSIPVTWTGTGFLPGAKLSFSGTGVTATVTSVTSTSVTANVSVATGTTPGLQHVTLTNANGGSVTSTSATNGDLNVTAAPGGTIASASALAGATTTLSFSGGSFATGVKVTSSNGLLTVGTIVVASTGTSMSVPVTAAAMSGTNPIKVTLTAVNPDGGVSSYDVTINMQPTVTGTYYVPTFSTNLQVVVTGTGFESGMTVSSSNPVYTVILGQVNVATSTAVLVVSTTSAATAGTSSTITFTNPDGGKVSFALNGGPAPTPTPVLTQPHVTGVSTFVKTGMTRAITLHGLHFMKGLRIRSVAGTTWKVMGVNPTTVRVQVTVTKASRVGWHRLFLTNPSGKSTSRAYQQK